jgi:hypothetical protein
MPIITKKCEECGKEFSGPNFSMKKRKFCEHACYAAARTEDLLGRVFGRLTVVEKVGYRRWRSTCSCGGTAISKAQNLVSGKAKSCGCLARELAANLKRTHGASDTRAHNTWNGIIQRCTNPNNPHFRNYGGRGIAICDDWLEFANFLRDMGQPPKGCSIERVDNNAGYSKQNCIWADRTTQQRNRRVVQMVELHGEKRCLSEWAEIYGLPQSLVLSRVHALKWSLEEALGITERKVAPRARTISKKSRWIEHGGKKLYLEEWCRELGLNSKTVHSRLARGASDLEALGLA